jgi:hypothetical protein
VSDLTEEEEFYLFEPPTWTNTDHSINFLEVLEPMPRFGKCYREFHMFSPHSRRPACPIGHL